MILSANIGQRFSLSLNQFRGTVPCHYIFFCHILTIPGMLQQFACVDHHNHVSSSNIQHLSSRLARLAVEDNLCHSFQAFHSSYSDTGLMGIYFVTDKNSIEDMMHWSQNAWSVMLMAPMLFLFSGQCSQFIIFLPICS